jgi:hypothetical protein
MDKKDYKLPKLIKYKIDYINLAITPKISKGEVQNHTVKTGH